MFKCQKVQITADAESALRPSSVRVVTRKRKDRKKKKRQGRGSEMGSREESRRSGNREIWADEEPKKKKKCIIVGCFIFSLVELLQWVRGEVGEGQESNGGVGMLGLKGHCCCVCAFFCFVLCVSGQLSAAVGWWLSLSMHGGALVLDFVQVLLLRHRQHRRQDLVVLPVCQAWNTNTQNIWELLIHRPALLTSTSAVQIKTLTLWNKPYFIC